MESGLKDEKPLALRTWSLNGGVIRIQLTRLADFADGDAIHGAIHAFTKALAGSRAPSDAALVEALRNIAFLRPGGPTRNKLAMQMERIAIDADRRSLRPASCWNVEVMNGGEGRRR